VVASSEILTSFFDNSLASRVTSLDYLLSYSPLTLSLYVEYPDIYCEKLLLSFPTGELCFGNSCSP